MRILRLNYGFTLIELVITVAILSVIASVGSKILLQGFQSYITGINHIQADWQGKIAMERMIRDIHNIPNYSSISTGSTSSTQLSYTGFGNSAVTYSLSGTNLLLNGVVLASNVSSLTFAYYDKDGTLLSTPLSSSVRYIRITVQVTSGNFSYTLMTVVYPWGLQ